MTVSSGSTSIGGAVGKNNICDMWQHFNDILYLSKDTSSHEYVLENIRSLHSDINMFTVFDVNDTIKGLKLGKSPGMDGLSMLSEPCKCAMSDYMYLLV